MKLYHKLLIAITLVIGTTLILAPTIHAMQDWDGEYFTYGSALNETQLKETEELIGVPKNENIRRIIVNSEDYYKFTGKHTKDSSLYSSVIIIKTEKGSGVNVYINTPENITQIEDHQYLNAALTSGLTDANIIVGSPVKVTGESALVGVYKALDEAGVNVNEQATKVASEELSIVNEISQESSTDSNFDSKELTLALAEIKEKIAEVADKDSLTEEDIANIVDMVLKSRGLNLSDSHKQLIIDWANKFKELDIDWKLVGEELKDIEEKVTEKTKQFYEWEKETGFFSKLWESIKSFFTKLFTD